MALSSAALPPSAVFTHQETLHAISLPPLASWLVTLRKPDQLIRLNDLLERYKTPQSYHRVDVRIVESSELPPGSPYSDIEETEPRKRQGSREIIQLQEGDTLDAYWSNRNGHTLAPLGQPDITPENIVAQKTPETESTSQHTDLPTSTTAEIPPSVQTEEASNPSHLSPPPPVLPPTPVSALPAADQQKTSPPLPTHPLPPIGPTRKVRELRLDLRTLDAAALFALETWRREELGLEKLSIEVPDSVWYKDLTPTPPPSPPPRSTNTGKPRGRPRRSVDLIRSDNVDTAQIGLDLHTADDQIPDKEIPTAEKTQEHGNLDDQHDSTEKAHEIEIPDGTGLVVSDAVDANGDLAQDSLSVEAGQAKLSEAKDQHDQVSAPEANIDIVVDPKQIAQDGNQPEAGTSSPSKASPNLMPTVDSIPEDRIERTPSPDIMLNDIFNEKEADDPDFIPPPSPPVKRTRTRKIRKSLPDNEGYKVTFDPNILQINDNPQKGIPIMSDIIDLTSRSSSTEDDLVTKQSLIEDQQESPIKEVEFRSEFDIINYHLQAAKNPNKRPSPSIIDKPSKKARKFEMGAPIIPKARERVRFVVEIPTSRKKSVKKVMTGSGEKDVQQKEENEEEGEEWDFLKSFG
ncbi:uncharacterized protein I206_104357 [Kwoniella pini CBS 10737]|uniref:Uncharacterized protein n=1 Tax=Kwoniella pini CBS 10737 TaxID=1296096 RepID=A0A1B9I1X0_9TREE|nr:uncharacterized protein I206_04065 [Kwoniella pini CBS 10737]OCF49543.1 hypothetical protein I206_04065 [Kwoniella pini CBS 10737]